MTWIRHVAELDEARARLGVAVAVSDPSTFQLHSGLVFRGTEAPPTVLHLRFHAWLDSNGLPDPSIHYVWAEVPLDEDRIDGAVAVCRRLLKRSGGRQPEHPIGYAVYYAGAAVTEQGALPLGEQAVGVTCATFVLSLLKNFLGVDLVDLPSWPRGRAEDAAWHARIVQALRDYQRVYPNRVSDSHIARVASEVGCARYRPEEIAAAVPAFNGKPVAHAATLAGARELVSGFICGAIANDLIADCACE